MLASEVMAGGARGLDESSKAHSLGFSLGFMEGQALASLSGFTLAPGFELQSLELELRGLEFPLDLSGGTEAVQGQPTVLRSMKLEVSLEAVSKALMQSVAHTHGPIDALSLVQERDYVVLEGIFSRDGRRAAFAAPLVMTSGLEDRIRILLGPIYVAGLVSVPGFKLPLLFERLASQTLSVLGLTMAAPIRRTGPMSMELDAVGAVVSSFLPEHGWKVPERAGLCVQRVALEDGKVHITVAKQRSLGDGPEQNSPSLLAFEAREDAVRVVLKNEHTLGVELVPDRFRALRSRLDPSCGPDVLVERLFALGLTESELHAEVWDLALDVLERRDSVPALLAQGNVAKGEGRSEWSALFETAAGHLQKAGHQRIAGLVLFEASTQAQPDREAQLLEEAVALRPDDVRILDRLMRVLPELDRPRAAVRAARRLASIAEEPSLRVEAFVVAGTLLRTVLTDAIQAKREFERALRLEPKHVGAREGLARVIVDRGDARRAASIFEGLIAEAEEAGRDERVAEFSVALGDIWKDSDPEAAILRYRKAYALAPGRLESLCKLLNVVRPGAETHEATSIAEEALARLDGSDFVKAPDQRLSLRLCLAGVYAQDSARQEDAMLQYERILDMDSGHTQALKALVEMYRQQPELDPQRAEILGRYAGELAANEDFKAAAALWVEEARLVEGDEARLGATKAALLQVLSRQRGDRALLDAYVEVSALEGSPRAVIEALDRRLLLEDPPEMRAGLFARLGGAFEEAGRTFDAIRAYEEALSLDDHQAKAIEALTRIYRERNDQERLSRLLDTAAAMAQGAGRRAELLAERARLLSQSGQDKEAYEVAARSLSEDPERLELLPLACSLALRLGLFSEARGLVERRLRNLDEKDVSGRLDAYADLARVAEGLEDQSAFVSALKNAFSLAPPSSRKYRALAERLELELRASGKLQDLAELARARAASKGGLIEDRIVSWVEAAHLSLELGDESAARSDLGAMLGLFHSVDRESSLSANTLGKLDALVSAIGSAADIAEVLGLRALLSEEPKDRERLRLEQASALEQLDDHSHAMRALQSGMEDSPQSIKIPLRLAKLAQRVGQPRASGEAYGRAARVAQSMYLTDDAIEYHGRAAEAYALADEPKNVLRHDRALLALCSPGRMSPWISRSLDRLQTQAQEEEDPFLLVEVLSRRAAGAAPGEAALWLIQKAGIESELPNGRRASLDSLRRARGLLVDAGSEQASTFAMLLEKLHSLGEYTDEASILLELAKRADDLHHRASYLLKVAKLYAESMGDLPKAVAQVQAAVDANPGSLSARSYRLELLRRAGVASALVAALIEEAERQVDTGESSGLKTEAAEVLFQSISESSSHSDETRQLERGLALVKEAMASKPVAPGTLRLAVRYAQKLRRVSEELRLLARLLESEINVEERCAILIRRYDLLLRVNKDPIRAQANLVEVLKLIEDSTEVDISLVYQTCPDSTKDRLSEGAKEDLVKALLGESITLTEANEDWPEHARCLLRVMDRSSEPEMRAEYRTRAGEVFEWKLGDGEAAEREYLAALALCPEYDRSRRALSALYSAADRFSELAENLGPQALIDLWESFGNQESKKRRILAGEALWPRLPDGGESQALVLLKLADLYRDNGDAEDCARVLREADDRAGSGYRPKILERLQKHYRQGKFFEPLCEVLRRKVEATSDVHERARMLVELGEVLELELGKLRAAEVEYRAALASDPRCHPAAENLVRLFTSQERFHEMGRELGVEAVERVLENMLLEPQPSSDRLLRLAEALDALLPKSRRGAVWLRVAERFRALPENNLVVARKALERAAGYASVQQGRALELLDALLEEIGEFSAQVNVLRQRLSHVDTEEERLDLHLRLGRRLLVMGSEVAGPDASTREILEEQAERELRAALAIDPSHGEASETLKSLFFSQWRLVELGRILGKEVLEEERERAERGGERLWVLEVLRALAEISEGPERSSLLLELIDYIQDPATTVPQAQPSIEELYTQALVANPGSRPARQGLAAVLAADERYKEMARTLGQEVLRETITQLRAADLIPSLRRALVALADSLGGIDASREERSALYGEVAELYLQTDEIEEAERMYRRALGINPRDQGARQRMCDLLVAQGRMGDLGEIDESLLLLIAKNAAKSENVSLEVDALAVLAERRKGESRADTLVQISALCRSPKDASKKEAYLKAALESFPEHPRAQDELARYYWAAKKFYDLVEALGSQALLSRAREARDDSPELAYEAVSTLFDARLETRAEALQVAAQILRSSVPKDEDWVRRFEQAHLAKSIWDELENPTGQEQIRAVIVSLYRDRGDVEALMPALAEAFLYASDADGRAQLALECAGLLVEHDRRTEARRLVEPLLSVDELSLEHRIEAARILVDELLAHGTHISRKSEQRLREEALVLLTTEAKDSFLPRQDRWLLELATVREALGRDELLVALPLESSLVLAMQRNDADAAILLRRRLRELYEQAGDWAHAEQHAAVVAEADGSAAAWIGLAELRTWLGDHRGAEYALERSLDIEPGSRAAHEALVRMAERSGEPQTVISRLESWAERGDSEDRLTRAQRMLRAARLAHDAQNGQKAALLAERAVQLAPKGGAASEKIAEEACTFLESLEDGGGAMAAILTQVIGQDSERASAKMRLKLADVFQQLGRREEAATVIDQGIRRDAGPDDPLVERLKKDAVELGPDRAVRRLLMVADRLGSGPAARRLRAEAAKWAEESGQGETARSLWQSVASEIGGGEHATDARQALLRIAREEADYPTLVTLLEEAAEESGAVDRQSSMLGEAAELAAEELGDLGRSEAALRRALHLCPDDARLRDRLHRLLERRGHWNELEALLDKEAEKLEGDALAAKRARQASVAEEHLRDDTRAAAYLKEGYQATPSIERGVEAVRAMVRAGALDEAAEFAAQILEDTDTESADTLPINLLRAQVLERVGAVDQTVDLLRTLMDEGAGSGLAELRLVDVLTRHGRWSELASLLASIASRSDAEQAVLYQLSAAQILLDRSRDSNIPEQALAEALGMAKASHLDGPFGFEVDARAEGHCDHPLLDATRLAEELGSVQLRNEALELYGNGRSSGAYGVSGLCLAQRERALGNLVGAERTLRAVLNADSYDPLSEEDSLEAKILLGDVLVASKRTEEAIELLKKLLEEWSLALSVAPSAQGRILITLAEAYRLNTEHPKALSTIKLAGQMGASTQGLRSVIIEAGGATPDLARLLAERAVRQTDPRVRARTLMGAAQIWKELEEPREVLVCLLAAHQAHPTDLALSKKLMALLCEAQQWKDLGAVLSHALSNTGIEGQDRVQALMVLARLFLDRLSQPEKALELALQAKSIMPSSLTVARAVADCAARVGDDAILLLSLESLESFGTSVATKRDLRLGRAVLYERSGDTSNAIRCLEEAIEESLLAGKAPHRSLVEWALRLYLKSETWQAAVTLSVRVGAKLGGAAGAAMLSRAADLRWSRLGDQRGAFAALEAALRLVPEDLGIRRNLLDRAMAMGDFDHARAHAEQGVEIAERLDEDGARRAFFLEWVHLAHALGDNELLANLCSRFMEDESDHALAKIAKEQGPQAVGRALAESRRLSDEAQEIWMKLGGAADDEQNEPRVLELDAMLSDSLQANEDNVGALALGAELAFSRQDTERATKLLAQLEVLGGPGWPIPDFELFGARVAEEHGDSSAMVARLARALKRDPGSPASLRAMEDFHIGHPQALGLNEYQFVGVSHHDEGVLPTRSGSFHPTMEAEDCLTAEVQRARVALSRGDPHTVEGHLRTGLELGAEAQAARPLWEAFAQASPSSRSGASALEVLVDTASGGERVRLLSRALDAALCAGDFRRARRLGRSLEDYARKDMSVMRRLVECYRVTNDGPGIVRVADLAGGFQNIGSMSGAQRITLARACFQMRRFRDVFILLGSELPERTFSELKRDLGDGGLGVFYEGLSSVVLPDDGVQDPVPDSLFDQKKFQSAQVWHGVRRALRALGDGFVYNKALVRSLKRLCVLRPDDKEIVRKLVKADLIGSDLDLAKSVYRSILDDRTADAETLQPRVFARVFEHPDAEDLRSINEFIAQGRTSSIAPLIGALPPLSSPVWSSLVDPALGSAFGRLMFLVARPVAAMLEAREGVLPRPQSWNDSHRRVLPLYQAAVGLHDGPFSMVVDSVAGATLRLVPGAPPTVCLGAGLVEEAPHATLWFHVVRAVVRLHFGQLLVEACPRARRGELLRTIASSFDAEHSANGPSSGDLEVSSIRESLSESDRLEGSALLKELGPDLSVGFDTWVRAVRRTADRVAMLVSGGLTPAVMALRRLDPRKAVEVLDTPNARLRMLRRWGVFSELLAYRLSPDYRKTYAQLEAFASRELSFDDAVATPASGPTAHP